MNSQTFHVSKQLTFSFQSTIRQSTFTYNQTIFLSHIVHVVSRIVLTFLQCFLTQLFLQHVTLTPVTLFLLVTNFRNDYHTIKSTTIYTLNIRFSFRKLRLNLKTYVHFKFRYNSGISVNLTKT